MSTSIQEQDLIQRIKELEQRLADIERQQRTIGGWTITPTTLASGNLEINSTIPRILMKKSGQNKLVIEG
jgi:hypothetical protein